MTGKVPGCDLLGIYRRGPWVYTQDHLGYTPKLTLGIYPRGRGAGDLWSKLGERVVIPRAVCGYISGSMICVRAGLFERGWLSPNAGWARCDVATTPAQARATPQSLLAKRAYRPAEWEKMAIGGTFSGRGSLRELCRTNGNRLRRTQRAAGTPPTQNRTGARRMACFRMV